THASLLSPHRRGRHSASSSRFTEPEPFTDDPALVFQRRCGLWFYYAFLGRNVDRGLAGALGHRGAEWNRKNHALPPPHRRDAADAGHHRAPARPQGFAPRAASRFL